MLQQASSAAAGEPPSASSSAAPLTPLATSASAVVESSPVLRRNLTIRGGSSLFGSRSKEAEQNSGTSGTQSAARRRNMGPERRKSSRAREAANTDASSKQETETTSTSTRYPQWHSAVAGAAAGAGSRLLTAPLDLLRIRRQLQLDHPPASSMSSAAFADAVQSAASKPIVGAASANAARRPGGLAGLLGRFPLLSSLAQIAREEGGYRSLYRGNVAATYLWITYAAVQFSLYSRTSDFLTSFAVAHAVPSRPPVMGAPLRNTNGNGGGVANDGEAPLPLPGPIRHALSGIASSPTSVAFVAGASAGLAATLTTYPFDLCRTTFAARGIGGAADAVGKAATTAAGAAASASSSSASGLAPPKSLLGFVRGMYRREGIRGFYAGVGPAAIQIVPYMGINFALYDYFTRTFDSKSVGGAGLAGTIAGGTSKFLVYPMDTIKKRLQAQATIGLNHRRYQNMADCAATMLREEGLASFYRGLAPTVLKSCAATGLTFAFYTFTKNVLESTHDSTVRQKGKREEK